MLGGEYEKVGGARDFAEENPNSETSLSNAGSKRFCDCRVCCCCFWIFFYFFMAWRLRVLCMSMTWPGSIEAIDWTYCSQFTYRGGDGTKLSGCRGLMLPKGGPYYGAVASSSFSAAKAPLIIFGGNVYGETASASLTDAFFAPQYRNLARAHPSLEVFASSYRSYAPNDGAGEPSESAVAADAVKLLDIVLASPSAEKSGGKVMLVGYSLGCAVAFELAARRPEAIAGIIVASPWTSLWAMDLTVWAPFSYAFALWLWVSDSWDSAANAAALPIEIPVAILTPLADEIVPPRMHKEVYDALKTPQKWLLPTPGARHGDLQFETSQNEAKIAEWLQATCSRFKSGC